MSDDLALLRQKIGALDQRLLELVAERFGLVREVARLKNRARLPIKDAVVEEKLIEVNRELARKLGLYEELAEDLTRLLIRYSIRLQGEEQS